MRNLAEFEGLNWVTCGNESLPDQAITDPYGLRRLIIREQAGITVITNTAEGLIQQQITQPDEIGITCNGGQPLVSRNDSCIHLGNYGPWPDISAFFRKDSEISRDHIQEVTRAVQILVESRVQTDTSLKINDAFQHLRLLLESIGRQPGGKIFEEHIARAIEEAAIKESLIQESMSSLPEKAKQARGELRLHGVTLVQKWQQPRFTVVVSG